MVDPDRAVCAPGGVDLDHVEAGLQRRLVLAEPELRRSQHPLLFPGGDELPGLAVGVVSAELDLHEGQDPAPFGDQVDLPEAAAVIARQDRIKTAAQIACRLFFPKLSQTLFVHQCIFLKKLGRCTGLGPNCRRAS